MEITTAREILETNHIVVGFKLDDQCTYDISVDSMIEFAKMHVEKALLKANKEAIVGNCDGEIRIAGILTAYPLDLIK